MRGKTQWETVIGLETHTQLSTASKIFSGASTAFGAAPNVNASAVDIALPGVLPVLNKGAVERAIRLGLAVGATINRRSVFARKNYFYPDLPKGYQISQYEIPVVQGGSVRIVSPTRGEIDVRLTRAHLEEDAGKSLHEDFHGMTGIDLNRAGTPLLEIVSEPDMRSAEEAIAYAKALHALVRWIGICDGNMQEGSFRCDANVSVRPVGDLALGTRCEIKNLNSFRFMQEAIAFEVRRQTELIEDGGRVVQETRLYDPDRRETRSMRSKEDAQDYRYFPDPDLPPLVIDEAWIERVRAAMPELPEFIKTRFVSQYSLPASVAAALATSRGFATYFEAAVDRAGVDATLAANWMLGELTAALNESGLEISNAPISPRDLGDILLHLRDGRITSVAAKTLFDELWRLGLTAAMANSASTSVLERGDRLTAHGVVDTLIDKLALVKIADGAEIDKIVDDVIAANPDVVEQYKAGKEKAFNALVGKVMAATRGNASPTYVNRLLKTKLS